MGRLVPKEWARTTTPPRSCVTLHPSASRYGWMTKTTVSVALSVLAVATAFYTFFGPFWPTEPEFSPSYYPSSGSPFDVPFDVTNRSGIFALHDLSIFCGLIDVKMSYNSHFHDFSMGSTGKNYLPELSSQPYVCPFTQLLSVLSMMREGETIKSAQIQFIASYDDQFYWPMITPRKTMSKVFELDTDISPPRWIAGPRLQ
jgi:hypothetical protein